MENALGDADFVHAPAEARTRPAATILTARLSNDFFRLSPMDFVSWFRFQLTSASLRFPTWVTRIFKDAL
jgi:hypothetical protein